MAKTKSSQSTSTQLLEQIEARRRQAEELKSKEVPGVVARMKEAIAYYGLTAKDLGLANGAPKASSEAPLPKKTKARSAKKAAKKPSIIKYRNAEGQGWTGVGRRPKWFMDALAAGATVESLMMASA